MCQKVNDFRVFFANIPEGIERGFEKTLKLAVLRGFTRDYSHRKKEATKNFSLLSVEKAGFQSGPAAGGRPGVRRNDFPGFAGEIYAIGGVPRKSSIFWGTFSCPVSLKG